MFTSSSAGNYYNMANGITGSATDRAIGILNSGSFTSPRGLLFGLSNTTGQTVSKVVVDWNYEKYRSGTRQFDWTFFSGTAVSGITTSQAAGDQSYAADANNSTVSNPPSSIAKSVTISSLSVANSSNLYMRWTLTGLGGSSNGQALGIDDFRVTLGVPLLYWDGDGTGTVGGGAGTWDTSAATIRWATGPSGGVYARWNNAAHDNSVAVFGGTAGAVTVATVTAGGFTFASNGYSLSSGTVTLDGATPTLTVSSAGHTATIASELAGTSGLTKSGSGTLILTGSNSYSGGTTVSAGTLQVGSGGTAGSLGSGAIAVNGSLVFNRSDSVAISTGITGSGTVEQAGAGTLTLTGTHAYSGGTFVTAGSVMVNGSLSSAANDVLVDNATLGGTGSIAGDVEIGANATIAPGTSPGTLTINGSLTLDPTSTSAFELSYVGAEGLNQSVVFSNDDRVIGLSGLTLDGTLDVAGFAGDFTQAPLGTTWTLFSLASGSILNSGLSLGVMPGLAANRSWELTVGASAVNLAVVPEPAVVCGAALVAANLLRRKRVEC